METLRKQKSIDSLGARATQTQYWDWPLARFARKYKKNSLLFSKFGKTSNFSTDNLYIHFVKTDRQAVFGSLDGFLSFRQKLPVQYAIRNRDSISEFIQQKYGGFKDYLQTVFRDPFSNMSATKLWNVSIVGALIFGMFLMTFIYRYLGQDTHAELVPSNQATTQTVSGSQGKVLGANTTSAKSAQDYTTQMIEDYQKQQNQDSQVMLRKEMEKMVKGYPIEKMIPYIAKQDKIVAAFMIGIAKQESDWGVHVPVDKNGNDCYNYWGFKGKNRVGTGGHSCFASRQDAVDTVAKRLQYLVSKEKVTTPDKMVVIWKCGYDCSWDSPQAVRRWVNAVNIYFKKFNDLTQQN